MRLNDIHKVYFIGIGGIGMSALARYFHSRGIQVSGYDKTETALTKELQASGISITYDNVEGNIPKDVELVVYTPAVPASHMGLNYYRSHGYAVLKRSEVLEVISNNSFNICVAGTHGKTTITTMIAHILRHSGYGCNAFLGGISVNYNTNFWSNERNVSVIEADEYDRSFLKLSPDIAIISAMDPDHLDIYGTEAALEQAFIDFSDRVKAGGLLISKFGMHRSADLKSGRHTSYSLQNESADVYAAGIKMNNGSYTFNVVLKDSMLENVVLNMGGMHNIENAVAAITVAHELKIDNDRVKMAIEEFKGVRRRFEYILRTGSLVFIDDYAHHPAELKALITSANTLFKGKKCTVIFQPHLFSRTRDFADEFAASLDLADAVILLPVYPARELPIAGVSSAMILDKMKLENKRILTAEELPGYVMKDLQDDKDPAFGNVMITAGAGDIDKLVQPLKTILESIKFNEEA